MAEKEKKEVVVGVIEQDKEKMVVEPIAPPAKPMEKFFKKKINLGEIRSKIAEFRKQGLSLLENLEENVLVSMIQETNDAYYNSQEALLTDNEFDILKEYVERRFPSNTILKSIGAPVERNKVKLPYEMPSMDKIKPDTGALSGWMKKYAGPYVLSCKLDGVSGLYVMEKGGAKLYTRGDGVVGQDITHLLRALKLPVIPVGVAIRGEFILPKRLFEEKYRGTFANPRNLVSGIINAKKVDEKASDLHFVAYEVISPEMIPSEQMAKIVEWKLEVVRNESRAALTNEELSAVLLDWRANYEYEIDGVIVCDDHIYPRVSGNPEHAFAFKMVLSEQMAECKVVDVIWTPSKNGYLKPRVRIEPVALGGVTIEYATGFNGKFIEDNKIGVGAMIQMIRSGDVIPYIKGVVVPAEVAKMPAVGYEWTDTGVDIVLTNKLEDVTVREKNVAGFFVGLEVDGLSIGNIRRLFKGGFDTVGKILRMSVADFESVEGFQKKMAEKIFGGIREKVAGASLLDVMVASNQMGRGLGEKKLAPIMEAFPDILVSAESDTAKVAKLMTVRGIGRENAAEFVANIRGFLAFLRDCGLEGKLVSTGAVGVIDKYSTAPSAALDIGHPLYGKKIVMTKIRDKEIIDRLPGLGAKLEDSMKKDVFALVVKSHADVSNKVDFAKKNGIPVFTPEEFKARFLEAQMF